MKKLQLEEQVQIERQIELEIEKLDEDVEEEKVDLNMLQESPQAVYEQITEQL